MRTYSQYCGLARALDLIGDRWSMLVIREVSLRDSRYSDIREGLPGIATNLLADRLRSLTDAGLIERFDAPPPVATPLYRLTEHGRALLPVLYSLVRWGTFTMVPGPHADDAQSGRWIAFAARAYLQNVPAGVAELGINLDVSDEPVSISVDERTGVVTGLTHLERPDIELAGSSWHVLGLLSGQATLSQLRGSVRCTGSKAAVQRLRMLLDANVDPDAAR